MAKKKAAQLVQYAHAMIGHPYWYGCFGQIPTASLLSSKARQYPSHYPGSMSAQRQAEIKAGKTVMDCAGLIKGFGWLNDAGKVVYASNGVADQSANGIYSAAKVKGSIKTMPEKPGLAVRHDGHIGVYVGNGYVVEARGRNYGVVKTKLSARPWTHWLEIPYIHYSGTETTTPKPGVFGECAIAKPENGENVRTLQTLLNKAGTKIDVDGQFGTLTEAAVKAYQKKIGVKQTGIADIDTIKCLIIDTTDNRDDTSSDSMTATRQITVMGDTVHIRKGPDAERFDSAAIAKTGAKLDALTCKDGTIIMADGLLHMRVVRLGYVEGRNEDEPS